MPLHLSVSLPWLLSLKRRIGNALRKCPLLKQLKAVKEAEKANEKEKPAKMKSETIYGIKKEMEEKKKLKRAGVAKGAEERQQQGEVVQQQQHQQDEWDEEEEQEQQQQDEWDEEEEQEQQQQDEWDEERDGCSGSSVPALSSLLAFPHSSPSAALPFSPHSRSMVRSVSLSSESILSIFVERFTG